MKRRTNFATASLLVVVCCVNLLSQTSTASISGIVVDERRAAVLGAIVTIKSSATGLTRVATTDSEGRFRFVVIPIGTYEVTAEAAGFSKYVHTGITLDANQDAVVDLRLRAGEIHEVVTVNENASILNTTTAETSTRFDSRRLAELPISPNGSVFNILLSVPGVGQLSPNQNQYAMGIGFSANGGRLRSNSFLLDGQDVNDPVATGMQIPLNNPEAIGEVRIITNQFLAEYGHNSASTVNFVGKSGTNDYHGSVFVFYNGERLNACSNLNKAAGFCDPNASDELRRRAPARKEVRYGFTFGGPLTLPWFGAGATPGVWRATDRTFFFGDYLRWTDRQIGTTNTVSGAPSAAGRATLEQHFGNRPQVRALLAFVPPGTSNFRDISAGGHIIQVGSLTGAAPTILDANQGSFRVDHRFSNNNLVYARYRGGPSASRGDGQVTPPGLTTTAIRKTHAGAFVWNSVFSSRFSNEARIAWTRFSVDLNAEDASSGSIPSIEINELGMTGTGTTPTRTGFGLAVNLPVIRANDTYQITESLSYVNGDHAFKFGGEIRRTNVGTTFLPNTRGRLLYTTLNNFLLDTAQVASINFPMPGVDIRAAFRWNEFYVFAQDEWKVRPDLTLTLGVRYEYPGDSFKGMKELGDRIQAANNNDPAFAFSPQPEPDTNNWMPRIGFNWNPRTKRTGFLGLLTGGDRAVIRGGYARTYDTHFVITNLNAFNSFPFAIGRNLPANSQPAFVTIQSLVGTTPAVPTSATALTTTRLVASGDFRAPATDQFSLELQRELTTNMVVRLGYIRTRGTGLLQAIDGNPRRPCPFGSGLPGTNTCNNTGINPFDGTAVTISNAPRVDPTRGVITVRANSASSTYDAMQISFEKRLSHGFSGGLHYTWSSFIDTVSEMFSPSAGESSLPSDPFNWNADRGRSSYDRPHRLTGNFVYEIPIRQKQNGIVGRLLGGWQVNAYFTLQSGAPFLVLNGSDPAGVFAGSGGDAIRPNVYTHLDVSRMTVAELYRINQQLLAMALATAQANFNALPPGPCVPGLLPGTALNNSLFSRATAWITCSASGLRGFIVDFNGIEPGQRVGNAGRNILRADGIRNIDFGIIKNTRVSESVRIQIRVDMFNLFNERNFGIPEGRANAASFLNQWATDGGNRRIVLGARLVF